MAPDSEGAAPDCCLPSARPVGGENEKAGELSPAGSKLGLAAVQYR
jgi:hypothetical protein